MTTLTPRPGDRQSQCEGQHYEGIFNVDADVALRTKITHR